MRATLNADKRSVRLEFRYDVRLIAAVKALPGRIFDRTTRSWSLPVNEELERSFDRLDRLGFLISTEAREAARETLTIRGTLQQLVAAEDGAEVPGLPLYPYQRAGVAHGVAAVQALGGSLNACDVGLGKTIQAMGVIQGLGARHVLVACPKSVLYQWQAEVARWLASASVVVADGSREERETSYAKTAGWLPGSLGVLVIGYESMRIDLARGVLRPEWDLVICDEAHRLGNSRTALYAALAKLTASHRLALTATPLMNKAVDLWGIAHWLSPGYLGRLPEFVSRYCCLNPWGGIDGYVKLDELAERLKPLVFRRTLDQVSIQLPELTFEDIPIELSATERKLYDQVRQELLFELEPVLVSKLRSPLMLQNVLTKLGKLQELTDSLELLGSSTESSKLAALKDHLADVVASGRKALVFTRFERMAQILARELAEYQPAVITGAVEAKDRQEALDQLTGDSQCKVMISTEAGGLGLNAQAASVVYHYDLPWSVGRFHQRTGRAHRIGQTQPVVVYSLIARRTIDEHVAKALARKRELSRQLLDDEPSIGWDEAEQTLQS